MREIVMGENEERAFNWAIDYAVQWCKTHQWEVGVAEMALGSALIGLGVQNGAIEMGRDIVGTVFGDPAMKQEIGAAAGAVIGATGAGMLLGKAILCSVGVATAGSGIAIPVVCIIGGATFLLGAAGYVAGDLVQQFLNPPIDPAQFFANVSLLTVGTALLVDGARRVIKDERVRAGLSYVKEKTIYLAKRTAKVVATTLHELHGFMLELAAHPAAAAVVYTVIAGRIVIAALQAINSYSADSPVRMQRLILPGLRNLIIGGATGLRFAYKAWNLALTPMATRRKPVH